MAGFDLVRIPRVQRPISTSPQQVRRLPTTAREAGVLLRSGLANPTRPDEAAYRPARACAAGAWSRAPIRSRPGATPTMLGLVDERGELTFGELDRRSNALADAWRERGLDHESTIALLCRDHRGLLDSMFAAGKLGAKPC